MTIRLNESQFNKLLLTELGGQNIPTSYNGYSNRIETAQETLENFLYNNGVKMINIENQNEYLVFELESLTGLIGRRYGLVQLVKDNQPYDTIYIKPIELYRRKY